VEAPQAVLKLVCDEAADSTSSSSSDESFGSSSSSSETANIRGIVKAHTICLPLSVGPSFAGSSGPLNVMIGIPGISASILKDMAGSGRICDKCPKEYGQVGRFVQEHGKVLRQRYQSDFLSHGIPRV
jgi:hypothetical protein